MAKDMLQELNEAYGQLRTQEPPHANGIPAGQPSRPSPHSSNGYSSGIDLGKTQAYWNESAEIFMGAVNSPIVILSANNLEQHLGDLNRYVAVNFQAQLSMAQLDAANVDPLAIQACHYSTDALIEYSAFITKRISLVSRATTLQKKYQPFWRMYLSRLFGKISDKEFAADEVEWKAIDPQLIALGGQIMSIEPKTKERVQAVAIQLVGKYGNSFQA
jgi:hypothetical protein